MSSNCIKGLVLFIGFTLVASGLLSASEQADFYVSTEGSDRWSGTRATPSETGDDGPFRTLSRARNAVRTLKKRKPSEDIVVHIRGGWYHLSETVVFGREDSGKEHATITYAAYPGEEPVFSSGKEIAGWERITDPPPGLPEEAQGNVWVAETSEDFKTLFYGLGLLPGAGSVGFIPLDGGSKKRLRFPEGTLNEWSNPEDVEILIRPHHAWILNILPLQSVNEQKQTARTSIGASYPMNPLKFLGNKTSCWIENAIDVLDEPGEWVLNTETDKVYLWPRNQSRVMYPRLKELIRVEGKIDKKGPKDHPVRYLKFRGLTFTHGERYTIKKGDKGLQHDWDMYDKANALVRFRGAENCVVHSCRFVHSGGGAMRVDLHGRNNRITGNQIAHIGGTGILLCGYGPGTKDVNRNNLVFNNHIHHTGQIYAHSPGIFLWQSGENRVANNLIHHTPYTGIILSGVVKSFFHRWKREMSPTIRWNEVEGKRGKRTHQEVRPYLHTHDNMIEYNEIHHVMQQLADGNGIYIRGAGPDNVIRRNYVHHLLAPTVMQSAIRTDGGQRDTLVSENIVYKCRSQGMQIKLNNHAENNYIINILPGTHKGKQRRPTYFKLIEGPMTGGAYKRNILYHPGKRAHFYREINNFRTDVAAHAKDADTDYNIYYCAGNPELSQNVLAKKQREGVDRHSLATDPHFVAPEKGNFRLRSSSPALELGIQPLHKYKAKAGLIQEQE